MKAGKKSKALMVKFTGFFFVFIGSICIIGIVHLVVENVELLKNGVETVGVVVDIQEEEREDSDGDIRIIYFPVFQFSLDDEIYIVENSYNVSKDFYRVGSVVNVIYHQRDPENAKIFTGKWDMFSDYVMGLVMVIILMSVGICLIRIDDDSKQRNYVEPSANERVKIQIGSKTYDVTGTQVSTRTDSTIDTNNENRFDFDDDF